MATAATPRVFKNFINGEWVESRSGQVYENRNPANTDELVGMFVSSNAEDVNAAVDAAKQAYKSWRLVPAPQRERPHRPDLRHHRHAQRRDVRPGEG